MPVWVGNNKFIVDMTYAIKNDGGGFKEQALISFILNALANTDMSVSTAKRILSNCMDALENTEFK